MIKSISSLFLSSRGQSAFNYGFKQISTQGFPLQLKVSPALWAEPLKKKKRIDPAIIKAREERKKKKIMKEIRKLQKLDRQLKPIAEFEVPSCLKEDLESRKRNVQVPAEVAEERILLLKEWSRVKIKEKYSDRVLLKRLIQSQKQALNELRLESEELYQAAVRIDENLIPLKFVGPTVTPPKDDYPIPDGTYIDVSKKWQ